MTAPHLPQLAGKEFREDRAPDAGRARLSHRWALFALTKPHQAYYLPDLPHQLCHRVVQGCNRGTAPPYPLQNRRPELTPQHAERMLAFLHEASLRIIARASCPTRQKRHVSAAIGRITRYVSAGKEIRIVHAPLLDQLG